MSSFATRKAVGVRGVIAGLAFAGAGDGVAHAKT